MCYGDFFREGKSTLT